jgi:uncharacterized membrane protein YfcA
VDIVILIIIGLFMGLLGGLLGIGGAVFMIPAMTFAFGENQHLYQAAAMICIFFVSSASIIAHHKANMISKKTLTPLAPTAIIGILVGVAISNSSLFEGSNDYILARVFGGFLVYVAGYNGFRLYLSMKDKEPPQTVEPQDEGKTTLGWLVGLITGLASGLLGIGAGTVATPLQQLLLKSPMKRAMSNSAVLIVCISWLGAIYKNLTLSQHRIHYTESFKIAIFIIPGAIIGGSIGGHLMHALPKNIVRIVFISVCFIAAIKLLTVAPN